MSLDKTVRAYVEYNKTFHNDDKLSHFITLLR